MGWAMYDPEYRIKLHERAKKRNNGGKSAGKVKRGNNSKAEGKGLNKKNLIMSDEVYEKGKKL
jgi:hypothetical protein